jgi:translocation and assembly module TamB
MKRIIRKIVLFIAWLLAGIIILLFLSGLLIQTQPVKNKFARVAAKQAGKVVNGELAIMDIRGRYFSLHQFGWCIVQFVAIKAWRVTTIISQHK